MMLQMDTQPDHHHHTLASCVKWHNHHHKDCQRRRIENPFKSSSSLLVLRTTRSHLIHISLVIALGSLLLIGRANAQQQRASPRHASTGESIISKSISCHDPSIHMQAKSSPSDPITPFYERSHRLHHHHHLHSPLNGPSHYPLTAFPMATTTAIQNDDPRLCHLI